jgi:hypothetical protein
MMRTSRDASKKRASAIDNTTSRGSKFPAPRMAIVDHSAPYFLQRYWFSVSLYFSERPLLLYSTKRY